jgi:hypothetical protein
MTSSGYFITALIARSRLVSEKFAKSFRFFSSQRALGWAICEGRMIETKVPQKTKFGAFYSFAGGQYFYEDEARIVQNPKYTRFRIHEGSSD